MFLTNYLLWPHKRTVATIPQATSSASAVATTASQEIKPVITYLPANGSKTIIFDDPKFIATYIEARQEIQIYSYKESKLLQSFKCDYPVKKLYDGFQRIYAQYEGDPQVKGWDYWTGKPIELPETWKKVDYLSVGRDFVYHSVPHETNNKPITLNVSDRQTLQLKHTITTEVFKIHAIIESAKKCYMTGLDTNLKSTTNQVGFMMVLEGLSGKKIEWYKKTYIIDSKETPLDTLEVKQGLIYNSQWNSTLNGVWDAVTYAPVLARNAVKAPNQATLTCVLGYTIVVADGKEIAIYKVVGENDLIGPGSLLDHKEESITTTFGTKILNQAKTIEIPQDNPLTSLHLFNRDDYLGTNNTEFLMVEGYANGLVRIRGLEDYSVKMEFHPPQDMKKVVSCQTYFTSNKLLVHYGSPSSDGVLATVWDLKEQKLVLSVTREALKNRKYDSSQDLVMPCYSGDLLVQSEDQVLYYEGIFKGA